MRYATSPVSRGMSGCPVSSGLAMDLIPVSGQHVLLKFSQERCILPSAQTIRSAVHVFPSSVVALGMLKS